MPKSQNAPDQQEQPSDWSDSEFEGTASDGNASDSGESTGSSPPPTPKKEKKESKEKREKKAPRPDASPYKKKEKKAAKPAASSDNTSPTQPKTSKTAKEPAPAKPILFQKHGMNEDGSRNLTPEAEAKTFTDHLKAVMWEHLMKQLSKGASGKPAAKGDVGKYNGRAGHPLLSPGAQEHVRKYHEALSTPFGRVSDAVSNFNTCNTGYTARLGLEHMATTGQ